MISKRVVFSIDTTSIIINFILIICNWRYILFYGTDSGSTFRFLWCHARISRLVRREMFRFRNDSKITSQKLWARCCEHWWILDLYKWSCSVVFVFKPTLYLQLLLVPKMVSTLRAAPDVLQRARIPMHRTPANSEGGTGVNARRDTFWAATGACRDRTAVASTTTVTIFRYENRCSLYWNTFEQRLQLKGTYIEWICNNYSFEI